MKVFWSWQSDTPGKIGRFLIRDALQEAIEQLKEPPDIEEPTTGAAREALHLDHDIKGESGSPDLARTILYKIDISRVLVADVTIAGSVPDLTGIGGDAVSGKKLINSNVAIELGYALHALSDKNVILVFNRHYGNHEDLPFDLRHKGGSIVFDLPPDAEKEQIDDARKNLRDRFISALKPYLNTPLQSPSSLVEQPSTFNNAAYFQKGESLAQAKDYHGNEVNFSYETETLSYLRLIPASPLLKPLLLAKLLSVVGRAAVLSPESVSVSEAQNDYGAIGYSSVLMPPVDGRSEIVASTQLFENGELWAISARLINTEPGKLPDWVKLPSMSCFPFERTYYETLRALLDFAAHHLGLRPPWHVELGLVGIRGLHLYGFGPSTFANSPVGPIRKPELIYRMILNDEKADTLDQLLLEFYSKVYDSAGQARPKDFHGFPPNRPSL